jgi:hypothetical protein
LEFGILVLEYKKKSDAQNNGLHHLR